MKGTTICAAMSRGTKIALVIIGLMFAASIPMFLGFVHAYYERSKISPGMDVSGVFIAADEWNLCISSSQDHKKFRMFNVAKEPGGQVYRVAQYDKTFLSKDEFLDFLDQEMTRGTAWNSQFTYYAGPIRNTYRVDFDPNGKVVRVSSMGGGP